MFNRVRVLLAVVCLGAVSFLAAGCGSGGSGVASGGGTGGSGGGTQPTNPTPTLASVSPDSATAGSAQLTITLTGSNFLTTSAAKWNDTVLTTTFVSSSSLTAVVDSSYLATAGSATITVVNPSPGGGASTGIAFAVNAPATPTATTISVGANDMVWDPVNKVIYLSLPSSDGANGNSVQVLNPATAQFGPSQFAGSEPNLLALSATSKYLYVGLNGASNVQRLTLPDLGTDITIPLGADAFNGPFYAMDVQASPVSDGTVAVVRGTPEVSPEEEGGVVIYDDGSERPNVLCGWIQTGCYGGANLYDSIQWDSAGDTMYAANYEDTAFDFYTIPVTEAGFGTPVDYPGLVPGFSGRIHYDSVTKFVYDDDGRVIDPSSGTVQGTFNASGIMVPDGASGVAYFVGQFSTSPSGSYTVESFDIDKFTPIDTFNLPGSEGLMPVSIIRWGGSGLAVLMAPGSGSNASGGCIYLISGSFVGKSGKAPAHETPDNVHRTWRTRFDPATGK